MLKTFPFAVINLRYFLKWTAAVGALDIAGQRLPPEPIWHLPKREAFALLLPSGEFVFLNNWIAAAEGAAEAYQFVSVLPEVEQWCADAIRKAQSACQQSESPRLPRFYSDSPPAER